MKMENDGDKPTFEEFYKNATEAGLLPDIKKLTITEKILFDYDLHLWGEIKEIIGVEKKHTWSDIINAWKRVKTYMNQLKVKEEIEKADLEQHFLQLPDSQMLEQVVRFIELGDMSDAEKELHLSYSLRHVRRHVPEKYKNNKKRRRKRR